MITMTTTDESQTTRTQMYELLNETKDDVVAIRMHRGTLAGYDELYTLLIEKTEEHGSIHVYEETPSWSAWTFLTHLTGIVPDLRQGPEFDIDRYATVGDNRWGKLLFEWWRVIRPVWPVAPNEMRYFSSDDRMAALEWVTTGDLVGTPQQ